MTTIAISSVSVLFGSRIIIVVSVLSELLSSSSPLPCRIIIQQLHDILTWDLALKAVAALFSTSKAAAEALIERTSVPGLCCL